MSRQIEFRVFDSLKKKFVDFGVGQLRSDYTLNDIFDDNFNDGLRYVLQQFTGLFDKNGVEIYEGDIVEFHSGYPNQNDNSFYKSKSAVEFENGAFWPRPILDHNDDDTWYNYELKDLKVIGNIFQNQELLVN